MNRPLILSALLLSASTLAQTQVWSDPARTAPSPAPATTERWSNPPKTQTASEPTRTTPADPAPTTGRWSETDSPQPATPPDASAPSGLPGRIAPPLAEGSQPLRKGDQVLVVFPPATIEYPGTIDRVRDGEYFIKFSGTIAPADAWVAAQQVRPMKPPPTTSKLPAFAKTGARVDVLSKGEWYGARILEVSGDRVKVRYDRYDASWDEWVGAERLRAPTKAATANPLPTGKFVCQVFEENQLKPQGEFVLDANGTYRDLWNKKSGSWNFDAKTSELRFTGVLQNGAKATYDPDQRRGMITFDWGNGVKRWCYR